jgi:hypothetical protein
MEHERGAFKVNRPKSSPPGYGSGQYSLFRDKFPLPEI